ncbi:MAG: hypothetical protein GVY16_06935 [Planctomycetes bacterium]|jgi:hypothetical protein|nr:hypothetical protein [Phycisphaerae bacterium]NBB95461.1 hypothetical protein [Planctomycetota bacterium]
MRKLLIWAAVAGLLVAVGCDAARWGAWALWGGAGKKVEAQYRLPHESTLAVMIYADREVQFDYPGVTLSLASQINERLKLYLTGSDSIKTVGARTIARYQDNNLNWDTDSKSKVAKDLGADYILLVSIPQYTTREPGQMSLYQARMIAEAKLYDAEDPYDEPVWQSQDSFHVVHPPEATYQRRREGQIRYEADQMLADKIARIFVDHKIPYDDEGREEEMP